MLASSMLSDYVHQSFTDSNVALTFGYNGHRCHLFIFRQWS